MYVYFSFPYSTVFNSCKTISHAHQCVKYTPGNTYSSRNYHKDVFQYFCRCLCTICTKVLGHTS